MSRTLPKKPPGQRAPCPADRLDSLGCTALALLPADRVLAAQRAWLSPLAPEGASVIVYKDTAHAPELADHQGIRPADLAAAGIVDHIVA